MFKSVEYVGFDGAPELRRLAEYATGLLPDEIRSFREDVSVRWSADPATPQAIDLEMTLELSRITAHGARPIPVTDFTDQDVLRSRLRRAWRATTDDYFEKRVPYWDEIRRTPVEV